MLNICSVLEVQKCEKDSVIRNYGSYSCFTSPFNFLLIRENGLNVSSMMKSYRTLTQDVYWGKSS